MSDDILTEDEFKHKAYAEGRKAASKGLLESANPYHESHHERDTTLGDTLHYQWWLGWVGDDE